VWVVWVCVVWVDTAKPFALDICHLPVKLCWDMYRVRWGALGSLGSLASDGSGMGLYHQPVNVHAPDASTVAVVSLTFSPISTALLLCCCSAVLLLYSEIERSSDVDRRNYYAK
jgi:hypothetical protein